MNLAWIDLETTGLSPAKHFILEAALVITDVDLNELENISVIIGHPDLEQVFYTCDPRVTDMHTANGLFEDMLSPDALLLSTFEVGEVFSDAMRAHGCTGGAFRNEPYRSPMCGSTVSFDRSFLKVHIPLLEKCFSYRHIDVTSLVELGGRWLTSPPVFAGAAAHRALPDVRHSIAVAKAYRGLFK